MWGWLGERFSVWLTLTCFPFPLEKSPTKKAGLVQGHFASAKAQGLKAHLVRVSWAVTWTQGLASQVHGANTISPFPRFLIFPSFGLWHLIGDLRSELLSRDRVASNTGSAHFGPRWPEIEASLDTFQLCAPGHVTSPLSVAAPSSLSHGLN